MNKFIQKIKSIFNKQKICIYYINGEKYITVYSKKIPFHDISAPDENTPAFENLKTEFKIWCEKSWFCHRLTGPAIISDNKQFYLNGKYS